MGKRRNKNTSKENKVNIIDNPQTEGLDESKMEVSEEDYSTLTSNPNPYPDYENNKDNKLPELDKEDYSVYTGLPRAEKDDHVPTDDEINQDTNNIWNNEPEFPNSEPDKGYISPRNDEVITNILNIIGG
jgi:hypothetical protein